MINQNLKQKVLKLFSSLLLFLKHYHKPNENFKQNVNKILKNLKIGQVLNSYNHSDSDMSDKIK